MAGPWEKYGSTPDLTAEKVDDEFAQKKEEQKQTYDTNVQKTTTSKVDMFGDEYQIPSFFTSPGGAVLAGGAAALAAYGAVQTAKGAAKAYTSISDRLMKKPEIDRTVDVQMDKSLPKTFSPPTSVGPITNLPGTPQELQKALGPDWEATIAKSDAIRKERQALAQQNARASMGELAAPPAPPPVAGGQPPAPPVAPPIEANPVAQAVAQTAPVVPPTVGQLAQEAAPAINAAAQAPAEAIPPAEKNKGGRKGEGKDKKLTYKTPAELPEGMVFKEGFGGADNWMKNSFNDESRIMIRDLFNEGKPYGANMEKAYTDARKYETWLKENIPVQTYARSERKAVGLPPPENYGKLGTAIKVGGIGGLLMTAGQAANAKQAAQSVGEALLPIGMTPSEAGAPVLPPSVLAAQKRQMEEMQKLGSPYRQR